MKALRRYIRLVLEQEEEERTPEQKVKELFWYDGAHALALGEGAGLDENLIGPMRRAIELTRSLLNVWQESALDPDTDCGPCHPIVEEIRDAFMAVASYGKEGKTQLELPHHNRLYPEPRDWQKVPGLKSRKSSGGMDDIYKAIAQIPYIVSNEGGTVLKTVEAWVG